MARLKFQDLTKEQLSKLRSEIVLNSLFVSDYENSFGFSPSSLCDFFDGYMEYLIDLAEEKYGKDKTSIIKVVEEFDNADNLFDYYFTNDDYSWVEYEPEFTPEEEKEYEDFWNGTEK